MYHPTINPARLAEIARRSELPFEPMSIRWISRSSEITRSNCGKPRGRPGVHVVQVMPDGERIEHASIKRATVAVGLGDTSIPNWSRSGSAAGACSRMARDWSMRDRSNEMNMTIEQMKIFQDRMNLGPARTLMGEIIDRLAALEQPTQPVARCESWDFEEQAKAFINKHFGKELATQVSARGMINYLAAFATEAVRQYAKAETTRSDRIKRDFDMVTQQLAAANRHREAANEQIEKHCNEKVVLMDQLAAAKAEIHIKEGDLEVRWNPAQRDVMEVHIRELLKRLAAANAEVERLRKEPIFGKVSLSTLEAIRVLLLHDLEYESAARIGDMIRAAKPEQPATQEKLDVRVMIPPATPAEEPCGTCPSVPPCPATPAEEPAVELSTMNFTGTEAEPAEQQEKPIFTVAEISEAIRKHKGGETSTERITAHLNLRASEAVSARTAKLESEIAGYQRTVEKIMEKLNKVADERDKLRAEIAEVKRLVIQAQLDEQDYGLLYAHGTWQRARHGLKRWANGGTLEGEKH